MALLMGATLTQRLEAITAAVSQLEHETEWTKVGDLHPSPHAQYLVRREGVIHTATPCYGMHAPWWVQKVMNGMFSSGATFSPTVENEPIAMLDGDEWKEIK